MVRLSESWMARQSGKWMARRGNVWLPSWRSLFANGLEPPSRPLAFKASAPQTGRRIWNFMTAAALLAVVDQRVR